MISWSTSAAIRDDRNAKWETLLRARIGLALVRGGTTLERVAADLAEAGRSGFSLEHVYAAMRGHANFRPLELALIADATGTDVDWLLGRDGSWFARGRDKTPDGDAKRLATINEALHEQGRHAARVMLDAVHHVARVECRIPAGDWPAAPVAAMRAMIDALEARVAEMGRPDIECCLDEGVDCCACMTGRCVECRECPRYTGGDDDGESGQSPAKNLRRAR